MRVLLIEDEPNEVKQVSDMLHQLGHHVDALPLVSEALNWTDARLQSYDVIIVDKRLNFRGKSEDGLQGGRALRQRAPDAILVMLTAYGSIPFAVEAIKAGFQDFLSKGPDASPLRDALSSYEERKRRYRAHDGPWSRIVGSSKAMRELLDQAKIYASHNLPILLFGETGTGKQLIVEYIASVSVKYKHLVTVDGPRLRGDANMQQSTLFGHVKGSFTGATSDRRGALKEADRGTLFIDEIQTLQEDTQTMLLRAIELKIFQSLGSSVVVKSDFRLVCATNVNLVTLVETGSFRSDLYYRLASLTLHVPPLRERGEDVLEIAQSILTSFSADQNRQSLHLDDSAIKKIQSYHWPGNVRQLKNVLERAAVLAYSKDGDRICDEHLRFESSQQGAIVSHNHHEPVNRRLGATQPDPALALETSGALATALFELVVKSEATDLSAKRVDYRKSILVIKAGLVDLSQQGRIRPRHVSVMELFNETWPLLDDQFRLRDLHWRTGESDIMRAKRKFTIQRLTAIALDAIDTTS